VGRTGREFWQHPQGWGGSARLNWYLGNHSLKFGGELRVDRGKGARFEPINFWFRQQMTAEINKTTENIGARRLHTLVEKLLEDISFAGAELDEKTQRIDSAYVDEHLKDLIEDRDLRQYIL
jgi:ATP-dependent HslUV protease ATP-binding subunit HslU